MKLFALLSIFALCHATWFAETSLRAYTINKRVDAATLEKLEEGFTKLAASTSKSLLKKYLTPQIEKELEGKRTKFGTTLLDIIQVQVIQLTILIDANLFKKSGLENPDSGVGIYAPDAEAYTIFAPLFKPIFEDYASGRLRLPVSGRLESPKFDLKAKVMFSDPTGQKLQIGNVFYG